MLPVYKKIILILILLSFLLYVKNAFLHAILLWHAAEANRIQVCNGMKQNEKNSKQQRTITQHKI